MTPKEVEQEVERIVESIKPILANHDPRVQGFTLAVLSALWIGGHEPKAREYLLESQTKTTRDLVPFFDTWASEEAKR